MTRSYLWPLSLGIAFLLVPSAGGADIAVFAPGLDEANVQLLAETLSPGKPDDVLIADSLENALGSDAKFVVLFADRKSKPQINEGINEQLQRKKVIGIGFGAAELFGKLGLQINGGACHHNPLTREPQIDLQPTPLRSNTEAKTLVAFQVPKQDKGEEPMEVDYNFAMYLPRQHENTRFVEAIARWQGDENYAPIVRQGNYIMIGLAAPPSTWTDEYKIFFRDLAVALAGAPKEPFSTAEFEITLPGEYEFELAPGRSTTELSGRTFYFKFTVPVDFAAELVHDGSSAVMLLFRGPNGEHHNRQDASSGQRLEIATQISQRDVDSAGEKYWHLAVTNFDRRNRARCNLRIHYGDEQIAKPDLAASAITKSPSAESTTERSGLSGDAQIVRVETAVGGLHFMIDDPQIETHLTATNVTIRDRATNREYALTLRQKADSAAEPAIEVVEVPDGLQFGTNSFKITRDNKIAVQVRRLKAATTIKTGGAEALSTSPSPPPSTEFAVFLGCGTTGSPGSIQQVSLTGEITGTIPVFDSPNGLVRLADSLVVANACPFVNGGQTNVVHADGSLTLLAVKESFPAPIAIAVDPKTQDLLIADNEHNAVTKVCFQRPDEAALLFRAPLNAAQKHYPSMSVAAVGDGHVVFSASDPKGVYRVDVRRDQTLPPPLLDAYGAVAADPTSQQWVVILGGQLKVFEGPEEKRSLPCPAGAMYSRRNVMTFAPDGQLYVVLQTGKGCEIQSVDLASGKFTPHFVWEGGEIQSMAVGQKMAWKH